MYYHYVQLFFLLKDAVVPLYILKTWFEEEGIPIMEPDLNPIENLWDQIATMVEEENPTNVEQRWRAVKTLWEGLPATGTTCNSH